MNEIQQADSVILPIYDPMIKEFLREISFEIGRKSMWDLERYKSGFRVT